MNAPVELIQTATVFNKTTKRQMPAL